MQLFREPVVRYVLDRVSHTVRICFTQLRSLNTLVVNGAQDHVLGLLSSGYRDSGFSCKQHSVVLECLAGVSWHFIV